MYAVVKFTNEDTIDIAPSNWLINDSICIWPPGKSTEVAGMVKKRSNPDVSWKNFEIKVLSQADSYEEARKKLVKAASVSDSDVALSSDAECYGRGKRKIYLKRYSDSEDDENSTSLLFNLPQIPFKKSKTQSLDNTKKRNNIIDSTESSINFSSASQLHSIENVIDNCSLTFTNNTMAITDLHNSQLSHISLSPMCKQNSVPLTHTYISALPTSSCTSVPTQSNTRTSPCNSQISHHISSPKDKQNSVPLTHAHISVLHANPSTSTSVQLNSKTSPCNSQLSHHISSSPLVMDKQISVPLTHANISALSTSQCTSASTQSNTRAIKHNAIERLYQQLFVIEQEQCRQGRVLDAILEKLNTTPAISESKDSKTEITRKFPLQSIKEVEDFEADLDDINMQNCLMTKLRRLGGSMFQDHARRIMRYLFTDDVAVCYNWIGTNEKLKFSSLKICHIIVDAIEKEYSSVTRSNIEDIMKTWLRHAKERKCYQKNL